MKNYMIAVYLHNLKDIVSFYKSDGMCIYTIENNNWTVKRTVAYDKPETNSISELRKQTSEIVNLVKECDIIAGKELSGIPFSVFDMAGFHIFTIDDLKEIKQAFNKIDAGEKVILTTEKDAVRLLKFSDEIKDLPFYVVPVRHQFLFQEESKFDQLVSDFVLNFKKED